MSAMSRKQKQVLGLATSYPLGSSDTFAVSSRSYSNYRERDREDVPSPYSASSSLQRTPTMPLRQRSILADALEDEYYPSSPHVDSIRALSTSTKASKASKISKIAATVSSGSLDEPISPTYPYDDYAQDEDETDDSEITDSEEDDDEEEDDWLDEIERPPGAPPRRRNTKMSSIVPTPTSAKSNSVDPFAPSGLARSNTTASHSVSSKAQRMLGLDSQANMSADDYRKAVQKGQGHASREVSTKAQRMLGIDQPGSKRVPRNKKRPVVKVAARLLETYAPSIPSRAMSSRIPSRTNTFDSEDTRKLLPIDESNIHPAFRKNGVYAESASSAEYPSLSRSSFQDSLSSREVLSPDEEVRARVFNPMAWEKMNSANSNHTTRNPAAVLTAPFVDEPLYSLYGEDNQPIFELGDSAPMPVELPAEFVLPQELPADLSSGTQGEEKVEQKEQEPTAESAELTQEPVVPESRDTDSADKPKSRNLANLSVEISKQSHQDSLPPVTSTSIYNTTKSPANLLTPPPPQAMVIPSPLAMALESGSPIGPLPAPWTIQQIYRPLRRPSTSDSGSSDESESDSEDDRNTLHQTNGARPDSETFTPPKPKKKALVPSITKSKVSAPFYDDGTSPESESHEESLKSRPEASSPSPISTQAEARRSTDSNPASSPLTTLLSDLQAQAAQHPHVNDGEESPSRTTYVPRPRQFSEPVIVSRKPRHKRREKKVLIGTAKSVGGVNRPFSFEEALSERDVGLLGDLAGFKIDGEDGPGKKQDEGEEVGEGRGKECC